MKLEYKILWLDDQIEGFTEDGYINQLKEHLEEKGFNATIVPVAKVDEFFSKLDDSFDFILTDYHMNEKTGDEIVQEIRKRSIFTEILFYTAQADLKNIDKADRITFLQTNKITGTSHQEKVIEKAISLIDLTIKKFQHIVAMRGMIMQEVSGLDAKMLEIISNYLQNNNDKKQAIIDRIFDNIIKFHKEKLANTEKFKNNNNFDKVINDPLLFSSSQRANAIEEIIKQIGFDNFISSFKKEIITVRNNFAHAVLTKDENTGREYFKDKNNRIDFNEEKCIDIRKNINKHKKNLDKLGEIC